MKYGPIVVACCALSFGSIAKAEDRAATDQLPAALQELSGASDSLVTEAEAREIRGTYFHGFYYHIVRPADAPSDSGNFIVTYGGYYWTGTQNIQFQRQLVYARGVQVDENSWSKYVGGTP